MTEIGRFFKQSGKVIVPLTVREILDEQIAMKLASLRARLPYFPFVHLPFSKRTRRNGR